MAHILIADDEPSVRDVLRSQLAAFGHEVTAVENGRLAAEAVLRTEYDLIVSDIRMPEMDGIQFLKTVLPRVEGTTPCIVLTGFHDVSHAIRAIQAGAYDYVRKPWELDDIRLAVNRALQRRADLKFRRDYQTDLERRVQEAVAELKATYDGTIVGFAAILEGKDTTTADHCTRVRDMCSRLGRELGLGTDRVRDLELGAMLHDIGKCKVPDAILNKPGALTPDEWTTMRLHPEFGGEIVEKIAFLRGASEVVRCHHERWDGKGYPKGLREREIPLAARIFMVVDAYDTITSKRPYKEPQPPEAAIDEIRRCAGTHFDPEVVAAFERVFPEFAQATRARHASAAVHAPVPVG
ncbi:MAG: response regulator [Planctomycetes bacterium]|nr:response regulator [Planctomycetota bacterium]